MRCGGEPFRSARPTARYDFYGINKEFCHAVDPTKTEYTTGANAEELSDALMEAVHLITFQDTHDTPVF